MTGATGQVPSAQRGAAARPLPAIHLGAQRAAAAQAARGALVEHPRRDERPAPRLLHPVLERGPRS